MMTEKIITPNDIPTEIWKYMREVRIELLTRLFNRILKLPKYQVLGIIISLLLYIRTKVISTTA